MAASRRVILQPRGTFAIAALFLVLNAGCSSPGGDVVNEPGAGGFGAIVTGNGGVAGSGTVTGGAAGSLVGSGGAASGGTGVVAAGGFATVSGSGGFVVGAGGLGAFGAGGGAGGFGAFGVGGGAGSGGSNVGGAMAAGGGAGRGGEGGGNGGAGGQGGAGGSAGSGDYRPCPTTGDPCKILPLGDSITWGVQYDGAYRVELFTKAVGDGKKITFTGSQSNGPAMVAGQVFPKNNEGRSGWTITQVAGLIPSPALNTPPHIVLLHIGTNDVYASSGQSTMGDRLGSLIDKITGASPDVLIAVAKIVPLSSPNNTLNTYNDGIPAIVKKRVDMGKHVIVVDLNTGFTPSMLSSDGVHPNKSGYDFMGDKWYAAISGVLP